VKYIPVEVFNMFGKIKADGRAESIKTGLQKFSSNNLKNLVEVFKNSNFTLQYFQNYPKEAKGFPPKSTMFVNSQLASKNPQAKRTYDLIGRDALLADDYYGSIRKVARFQNGKKVYDLYYSRAETVIVNGKEKTVYYPVPTVDNGYVSQFNPHAEAVS
ncbi:hypothetical protein RZS08_28395, partial [Arthrospira platensis SPKY1]|nr:hypothetical protein [Arthrospira platensis SPKY1]